VSQQSSELLACKSAKVSLGISLVDLAKPMVVMNQLNKSRMCVCGILIMCNTKDVKLIEMYVVVL